MSSSHSSSASRRRRSGSSSQASVHNYFPSASLRNGYPSIDRQNTQRVDNRSNNRSSTQQNTPRVTTVQEEKEDIPLHDRIASSAVAASLEFLRIAGGVTLSTTGTLMQPPLHVTQKYVLPQLWHAFLDLLQNETPERLQDWFRIVSSSVYHFISVLRETVSGQALRERLLIVWVDLVQVLATDASRQALMEFTACWVKFAAWCDSTECHDYLDQLCVYWIRVLQILSSGKTQQLILDCKTVVQSLAQVLNDPQTTTAWAEVTAYLCYALEMEQAKVKLNNNPQQRHDRDVYQQNLHHARLSLLHRTKPDGTPITVEEAILSSMGKLPDDLPTQIVCNDDHFDHENDDPSEEGTHHLRHACIDWDQESSIRQQLDESMDGMPEKVRKEVDVDFLKNGILRHVEAADERGMHQPRNGNTEDSEIDMTTTINDDDESAVKCDVEDVPLESKNVSAARRTRASLDSRNGTPLAIDPWHPASTKLKEGETAVQHFYRVLDSILEEKRSKTTFAAQPKGRVRQSAFSAETLKQRLLAQSLPKVQSSPTPLRFGARQRKWIFLCLGAMICLCAYIVQQ
ncbi:hypothetical protein FisN_7Lh403 [Fistulifera solaris]|uniref:Uncharacterized protein n=1 Tax=Fistulifera solaris TaxID=1519565 RepID=A0A1Z5JBD8_FISSO|nr:hypothetical protein FisN_7Lh403 [Fistulifera solaris]|eukprot:GAX11295.1 hypothetical protein FisN_7Lh403 [Fistulifera solaris]